MKNLLISDIKNSFFSLRFWLTITLILVSAVINYILNNNLNNIKGTLNVFLYSTTFGFSVFTFTAPIIAVLPFGLTYYKEIDTGYIKQMLLRLNGIKHYLSRIISCMVVSALAIIVGFAIVLLLSFIIDPSPSYRMTTLINNRVFGEVYDYSMVGYIMCFVLNAAIYCGLYSIFGMSMSSVCRNKYLAIAITAAIYIYGTMTGGIFLDMRLLPFSTFTISNVTGAQLLKDHIVIGIISLIIFALGYLKWNKSAS